VVLLLFSLKEFLLKQRIRLLNAPLAFCLLLNPSVSFADIPAPKAPARSSTPQLQYELSDGVPPVEAARKVALVQPLAQTRLHEILQRLPERNKTEKPSELNIPASPQAPPRPEPTQRQEFPPKAGPAFVKPTVPVSDLRILRRSHEGEVDTVPELTISFSQPMVALTDVESEVSANAVPVSITPTPEGKWHWLGTQTLAFRPKNPKLKQATKYELNIPAGTKSVLGGKLEKSQSWLITTARPKVSEFSPLDRSDGWQLNPVMHATFNQPIDKEQALKTIRVKAGKLPIAIRLVNKKTDPKVSFPTLNKISEADDPRFIFFRPVKDLPRNAAIEVSIGPGIHSLEGPLPSRDVESLSFHTYEPFRFIDHSQEYNSIQLNFSNAIDAKRLKAPAISVTPPVAHLKVEASNSYPRSTTVSGDFRDGTKYSIAFGSSICDEFGQRLIGKHSFSFKFKRSPAEPQLSGLKDGGMIILEGKGHPFYSFTSANQAQVKVTAYAAPVESYTKYEDLADHYSTYNDDYKDEKKAPQLPAQLDGFKKLDSRIVSIKQPIKSDDTVETKIDLAPYLKHLSGNVIFTVEQWPRKKSPEQHQFATWIQVTPYVLDAFYDEDSLVACASRLADGKPVSGAKIRLFPKGETKKTDANGLAKFELADVKQNLLVLQRAEDLAFLPAPTDTDRQWSKHTKADEYRWHAVTDRNLYRPSETVNVKGWVRRLVYGPHGDLQLLADNVPAVEYTLTDSTGKECATGTAKIDSLSAFNFAVELPKDMNLGEAKFDLSLTEKKGSADAQSATPSTDSVSFRVEEFRRPEFEMSVAASQESVILGEPTSLTATAKYYSGGPLADTKVDWTVSPSETSFAPPGLPDYSFGDHAMADSVFFSRPSEMPPPPLPGGDFESKVEKKFQGLTDANGRHTLKVRFTSQPTPVPLSVTAQATVTDLNRQQWSDKASLLVHPASVYVGLKTDKCFYRSDESITIEAVVADLDGQPAPGRTVHLEVKRTAPKQEGKAAVTTKIADNDITGGGKPFQWKISAKGAGIYNVKAVVVDEKGRKNQSTLGFLCQSVQPLVQAYEEKPPTTQSVEKGSVELLADHSSYQPGDIAELLIKAPFADGHGLVTVSRNGLISSSSIALKGTSGSVRIPVTQQCLPQCEVQVDLTGTNCQYASGTLSLTVPAKTRELKVEVQPKEKNLAPGTTTTLSFKLHDAAGKAVNDGQIAVAVVDESVLALTGYDWSNPLSVFYAPTGAGVSNEYGHQYVLIEQQEEPKKESKNKGKEESSAPPSAMPPPPLPGAADGGMPGAASINGFLAPPPPPPAALAISLRTDFSALAYFNADVRTDADGTAAVDFKLPDNLTRYRVMAIAAADARHFGFGESSMTAKLPLMVRPSLPRFLNFGDKSELPVVLHNQSDQPMHVEVAVRASNLALVADRLQGDQSANVQELGAALDLPANEHAEVRFPALAKACGQATVEIAAVSGQLSDAATVSLPVYTPATSHANAVYGQIDKGAQEQIIDVPKDVFDQVGGLEVSTTSTAMQNLLDSYLYLENYGFACSEQLSSRILSTVALQNVLSSFSKVSPEHLAKSRQATAEDINQLVNRQNEDGSFGLWKKGDKLAWPFVSIQVLRALYQAQTLDYKVPDSVLDKGREYLWDISKHIPSDYGEDSRKSIKAYALFVRSQIGEGHVGVGSPEPEAIQLVHDAIKSFDKPGSNGKAAATATDLSAQQRLGRAFSIESAAWLLSVLSNKPQAKEECELLRAVINSQIAETASTAGIREWSYGEDNYHLFYSDTRADAVVLEALIADNPKNDLIAKLAAGLLAQRKDGCWMGTQENAYCLTALQKYFATYEKDTPDFVANSWLGKQFVGATKFVGRTTETNVVSIPMRFLQAHQDEHDFVISKDGPGRLYYRLAMNYAPRNLKLPAYDNGFKVERTYEAVDSPSDVRKEGDVWHIKAGSTVRVKIDFHPGGTRYHVALTDPLPAGMEVLNSELRGARELRNAASGGSADESAGTAWNMWWRPNWFDHQNLRDFRAEAFASIIWPGDYKYTYIVRATTPGTYLAPPTKLEEMYTPETFGRAAAEMVVVE